MPVYNGEKYIEQALSSIIAQSWEDFELIISDNASTDNTRDICMRYAREDNRVRYYRHEHNVGAARNYNRVFALARGRYFKWAAHDDVLAPNYIEHCVARLESDSEVVVAFPYIAYIDDRSKITRLCRSDLALLGNSSAVRARRMVEVVAEADDLFWAVFGMIRADALAATNLIETYVASDQVLMFHLALLGKFALVPEVLFYRREHAGASMKRHMRPADRAQWFDTLAESQLLLPNWRLGVEHLKVVVRQERSLSSRVRCTAPVVKRFGRKRRHLGGELKSVLSFQTTKDVPKI